MISSTIALLTAIFKAVPSLRAFWEELVAAWIKIEIARMRKENRDAIKEAFDAKDQRPIENIIRSPRAGLPSGTDGSELRDSLPGVMQDTDKS